MSILKRIFGIGGGDAKPEPAAQLVHEGYRITAAPIPAEGQFRIAGTIEKISGGEGRRHDFVRADLLPSRDGAVDLTFRKAKQIIKEQGDRMFG